MKISNLPAFPPVAPRASSDSKSLKDLVRLMTKDSKNRRTGNGVQRGFPSDDEDEPVFDLAAFLTSHKRDSFSTLPVTWLGEPKRLEILRKLFEKAKTNGKPSPYYIASSPFEEWVPSWVGKGESPSDKTFAQKAWKSKVELQCPSHALSMISTFWLSHAAVGIVNFGVVLAHMLCVVKMHSDHGLLFAIRHERRLVDLLQLRLDFGESLNLAKLLSLPVQSIVNELLLSDRDRPVLPKDKKKPVLPPPPPPPPGPKTSAKVDSGTGKGSGKGSPGPATSRKLAFICFLHDPASKKVCTLGA